MKNYYEVLELTADASRSDIKKSYFKLVRKYPPDRYEQEFMAIREAYEILSDEKSRIQYNSIHTMSPFVRSNYEYAKKYIEDDDLDKAIKILEDLTKYVPDNSVISLLLGEAYRKNYNNGKAIKLFEKLVNEEPANSGYVGHLANAYLDRGWNKKAIAAFEKAIVLDSDNISLYMGLSHAYLVGGDISSARKILKNAVNTLKDVNEDNTAIFFDLIMIDIMSEDIQDLEEHLNSLFALANKNEEIKDNVGWTLGQIAKRMLQCSRIDEAKSIVERALKLLPNDEEILEIQNEILNINVIEKSFELICEDNSISDDIKQFMEIEIYHDHMSHFDKVRCEAVKRAIELYILEEINVFKKELKLLKEKYPELYNLRRDYFDGALNVVKRNEMIKEHRKQNYKYNAMMNMFKNNYISDEDEYEFDDVFVEEPYVREEPKIGRNDPCPCGSGKKFKKCCG